MMYVCNKLSVFLGTSALDVALCQGGALALASTNLERAHIIPKCSQT